MIILQFFSKTISFEFNVMCAPTDLKLEVQLRENEFEIVNDADKKDNAIYQYALADSLELKTGKINWFVTAISFIVEFFIVEASSGGVKREKDKLLFHKWANLNTQR